MTIVSDMRNIFTRDIYKHPNIQSKLYLTILESTIFLKLITILEQMVSTGPYISFKCYIISYHSRT